MLPFYLNQTRKKPKTNPQQNNSWSTMPAKIYQALPYIKQTPCNINMHPLLALQREPEPMLFAESYNRKGSCKAAYCRYFQRDAHKAHGETKRVKTLPASVFKCHKGISLNNCSLIILPMHAFNVRELAVYFQTDTVCQPPYICRGRRKPPIRWSLHSEEMEKRPHGRHRGSLLAAKISRMKARLPVQPSFIYKRKLHLPQWKKVLEKAVSAWQAF